MGLHQPVLTAVLPQSAKHNTCFGISDHGRKGCFVRAGAPGRIAFVFIDLPMQIHITRKNRFQNIPFRPIFAFFCCRTSKKAETRGISRCSGFSICLENNVIL
jgi:hypothetical protein